MFTASLGSVLLVLFLLFFFRKNLRQVSKELPEATSNLLTAATVATDITKKAAFAYGVSAQAELVEVTAEAQQKIQQLGGPVDFEQLYKELGQPKKATA